MITHWESAPSFTRLAEYQPNCWINLQEPTNEEFSFGYVIAISVVLVLIGIFTFKRKNWF